VEAVPNNVGVSVISEVAETVPNSVEVIDISEVAETVPNSVEVIDISEVVETVLKGVFVFIGLVVPKILILIETEGVGDGLLVSLLDTVFDNSGVFDG